MNANYYFCSQSVVDQFKPEKVSKPFKSGFEDDGDTAHYVAWIDHDEVEIFLSGQDEEAIYNLDFWYWECIPGCMDVTHISLEDAKTYGLLYEIWFRTALTKTCNQAMSIFNLAQREGLDPIQLINKIA